MSRPLREARVDLGAIARNIQVIRRTTETPVMVVVKAAGYGHGAVPVARVAAESGADWLGVVSIEEGLELRAAGVTTPILAWLHDPAATFEPAIDAGIDLGVSYLEQLDRVAQSAGIAQVQLKVDTGLGRNGAADDEWPAVFAAAAAHERAGRIRVRGLWSHLANSGLDSDLTQVAAFERAIALARDAGLDPQLLHLAASAGALGVPSARFSLVRIGIAAYGLSPLGGRTSADLGLVPALELGATIASVKRVPAGSGVSYGSDYRTTEASTLALVPLGYGDGIPRSASGAGPVSINGRTYRVAGRIAMDQFVVDVGDDPVAVGDRAILFGDPATGVPSVDDWADAAGTINYEIVTRLGGRVSYTYLNLTGAR